MRRCLRLMYEVFYFDDFGRTRMRFDCLEDAMEFAKSVKANVWRERDGALMASFSE